jgi:periplasmic divalent cation tolerance protein
VSPVEHMSRPTGAIIVFCTCPTEDAARAIGRILVDRRLAACVNVHGGVRSIYRWRDAVAEDAETLMVIKTTAARYAALERLIIEQHPYELPEIVAVPIERGFEQYLAWIEDSTS